MLFSSMIFLWCFLPIVLIVNYIISFLLPADAHKRIRLKNIWLLLASIIFYAWGGVNYLLIMFFCIVINYMSGKLIATEKYPPKTTLTITIIINLIVLFIFKYSNMVAGMFKFENWTEIVLPIGISFYTFQALSYVIDVYRDRSKVQNNIFDFALYVSLFPQLIAGPIVKYSDISAQITQREENVDMFYEGQRRFCYGLGKKVLIANVCAQIADEIWAADIANMGAAIAWLGMIAYTLQIYYDFSGYSDMAIGIGKMLGFNLKENFNYPYIATSVQDFWRRWHISLSGWFRDYVYIPLGGNRKGIARTCINLFIVFLLTGIWHGAGLTFMLWGVLYAFVLIIERVWLGERLKANPIKAVNYIYTMLIVMIAWVLFRSDSISQAGIYLSSLFKSRNTYLTVESYLSMTRILALVAGIVFMGPVQKLWNALCSKKPFMANDKNKAIFATADMIVSILVLVFAVMMLISGTYNPFIYFRF